MESAADTMTFEEFAKVVAKVTRVDEDQITPDASFLDDLYVDSIKMLEVVVTIETYGVRIAPEDAWKVRTVGDAYEYYSSHKGDAS